MFIFIVFVIFILYGNIAVYSETYPNGIVVDSSFGGRNELVASGDLSGGFNFIIKPEYGMQKGSNLFHSFERFNLNQNQSATFVGPSSIQTIISRITSNAPSMIDGKIISDIHNAGLIFMNSSGVIFGPNAKIDISGSFAVTTADYVQFDNQERFYSIPDQSDILSIANISAFGFLDQKAAPIIVNGPGFVQSKDKAHLSVNENKNILLIAGDIEFLNGARFKTDSNDIGIIPVGSMSAPNGKMSLISVDSKGSVLLTQSRPELLGFDKLGNISIKDYSALDVAGGKMSIFCNYLTLDNAFINAGQYYFIGEEPSGGNDGYIHIDAKNISLSEGGAIVAETFGKGKGGDITLNVSETLSIQGHMSVISCSSRLINPLSDPNLGNAGNIIISSPNVFIRDGAIITSTAFGKGNGGKISINSDTIVLDTGGSINTSSVGEGNAGLIYITTKSLLMESKAGIISATGSKGHSGNIEINSDNIRLDDSFISTSTDGQGDAGSIFINTKDILIDNSYIISLSSEKNGGDSGFITICGNNNLGKNIPFEDYNYENARNITIKNSKVMTSSYGNGGAGFIMMAAEQVSILQGSYISSSSYENGKNGGYIFIKATESLKLNDYSNINSEASEQTDAGGIAIDSNDIFIGNHSYISSASYNDGSSGGIIVAKDVTGIDLILYQLYNGWLDDIEKYQVSFKDSSRNITLQDNSFITTSSQGHGNAGVVDIISKSVTLDRHSGISSESLSLSNGGAAGLIFIDADHVELFSGSFITTKAVNSDVPDIINNEILIMDRFNGRISLITGFLKINDSSINSSVLGGLGNGGNIVLNSDITVVNRSTITANAHEGNGGNVQIRGSQFVRSATSTISASSQLGIDGTIVIESPYNDSDKDLNVLPSNYLDPATMKNQCEDRYNRKSGRLSVEFNDGIGSVFDDLFPSPIVFIINGAYPKVGGAYENLGNIEISEIIKKGLNQFMIGNNYRAIELWQPVFEGDSLKNLDKKVIRTDLALYLYEAYCNVGLYKKAANVIESLENDCENPCTDFLQKALIANAFGDLMLVRGHASKAIEYFRQAEQYAKQTGSQLILSCVYNNLGNAFFVEKNTNAAQDMYNLALQTLPDKTDKTDKSQEAEALIKSIVLLNKTRSGLVSDKPIFILSTVNNCVFHGSNFRDDCRDAKFCVSTDTPINDGEYISENLNNLLADSKKIENKYVKTKNMLSIGILSMEAFSKYNEKAFLDMAYDAFKDSLFYAKQIENTRIQAYATGYLGQIEARWGQVEKAFALTRKAIFLASQYPEIKYLLEYQLGNFYNENFQTDNSIKSYKNAIDTVTQIRNAFFNGYRDQKDIFKNKIKPVYLALANVYLKQAEKIQNGTNAEQENFLIAARDTMELLKTAEVQDFYRDECVQYKKPDKISRYSEKHTAILYPICFQDHMTLMVTLENHIIHVNVPVDLEKLTKTSYLFRESLEQWVDDYQDDACHLFDWLIRPIEKYLIAYNIRVLMIVPDSSLSMIPFAALNDGKRFLIEKYAVVTIPAINMTDTNIAGTGKKNILLGGLSESSMGFIALPGVKRELSILKQSIGGEIFVNDNYTPEHLRKALSRKPYNMIHLATHGVFGDSQENTFLLAYNAKLTMDMLQQLMELGNGSGVSGPELLTLSACQTALGNERAAFGLAGVAVKAGVKSAVATLWSVDDNATCDIVKFFYEHLKTKKFSKAESLQLAQKAMIKNPRYKHPTFWGAFLLIGNYR